MNIFVLRSCLDAMIWMQLFGCYCLGVIAPFFRCLCFHFAHSSSLSACRIFARIFLSLLLRLGAGRTPLLGPFVDAGSRSSSGNTFSNMPTPGSVARPDRLLYTETPLWTAVSSQVVADDPEAYRQRFWMHLFAERLLLVLANEACLFDCGPRGKCVCGVCILAAEENCPPPCPICENFAQKITLTVAGYLVGLLLLMRLCRHCHKWMRLVACVVFLMTAPLSLRIVAPTETGIIASRIMPEEFFASDHRLLLASFLTS
eukprot:m.105963 g.105963  ORF g.105963 m.105963 type:complete len:259 (+) comp51668_c0_seq1:27-803(+)